MGRSSKHGRKAASEFYKDNRGGGYAFAENAFGRDLQDGSMNRSSQIKQLSEL